MVNKVTLLKLPKHKCPSCDSPAHKVIGQHQVDLAGAIGDQAYQSILFKRVVCQGCKQHSMMKDYVAAEEVTKEQI